MKYPPRNPPPGPPPPPSDPKDDPITLETLAERLEAVELVLVTVLRRLDAVLKDRGRFTDHPAFAKLDVMLALKKIYDGVNRRLRRRQFP